MAHRADSANRHAPPTVAHRPPSRPPPDHAPSLTHQAPAIPISSPSARHPPIPTNGGSQQQPRLLAPRLTHTGLGGRGQPYPPWYGAVPTHPASGRVAAAGEPARGSGEGFSPRYNPTRYTAPPPLPLITTDHGPRTYLSADCRPPTADSRSRHSPSSTIPPPPSRPKRSAAQSGKSWRRSGASTTIPPPRTASALSPLTTP